LHLGTDYDDGYVAWINGVEIYRSPEMPAGALQWDTLAGDHESNNGAAPFYFPLNDISALGIPALQNGDNVLAVGVWNTNVGSSDLVLAPQLTANQQLTLLRGPYLQLASDDSITVRWRTDLASDSQVLYGTQQGNLTSNAQSSVPTREHIVPLSGLDADTTYYYAIGSISEQLAGDDPEHFFLTAPVPATPKPTRVWVIGDSGSGNADAMAVRDAYATFTGQRYTDVWTTLGDNAYPDGTDLEHQEKLFDFYPEMLRKTALWPNFGNHDVGSADSQTQSGVYYDVFSLPTAGEAGGVASGTEAYYSFDHANIHFLVLNSTDVDRSAAGPMATWLESDLSSTLQDWIIAGFHHPPYSKGFHDSDLEIEMTEVRTNIVPILEAHGVDLVMGGHSHSYERSFLIDGHYGDSTTFTEAMKLDGGNGQEDGDGAYVKPMLGPDPFQGAVYVVAGSSGLFSSGPFDHPAMYTFFSGPGSLILDVDANRLDATFLNNLGNTQDYFTLIKLEQVAIGDRVWEDSNGNGIQDEGATGMPGVLVVLHDGNGSPVSATFTDSSGGYQFTGLDFRSDYSLRFVPPAGYTLTLQDQGADDLQDSDADITTWRSPVFNLAEPEDFASWDAGMVPECIAPDEPVYLFDMTLTNDGNAFPVLHFMDPNQPTQITGYNVYRSSDAAAPPASWPQVASNIEDGDAMTPNQQWVDDTGDVSPTGIWFYQIAANNVRCPAEGPR